MKRILAGLVLLALASGCVSVKRSPQGDFSLNTFGTDIKGDINYSKTSTNGTETFHFNGSKNGSESTHTAANLIGGAIGAVAGTAVQPGGGTAAGAVKGAAVGAGLAEVIQAYKDEKKKAAAESASKTSDIKVDTNTAPVPVSVVVTNRLGVVSVPPYTDAGLAAAGNSEECPQTKAGAGVVRFKVDNGHGGQWSIGHLLDMGYDIDGHKNACGKDFDADGGHYYFLGYSYDGGPMIPTATGIWFPYRWVTHIWFEFRK